MVHIKCPDCLLLEGTGLGVPVTSGSFNSLVALPFQPILSADVRKFRAILAMYNCVSESRIISIVSELCNKSSKAMKLPGLVSSST